MEAKTTKFSSILLLLAVIGMLGYASADIGYGKPRVEGYVSPKPDAPKEEHPVYQKTIPKMPTKPVIPKEDHGAYHKTIAKVPTKPVIPKEEHGPYEHNIPKLPTKPVIPKKENEGYGKGYPKLPTKPVIPKEEHGAYDKNYPKIPTPQKSSLPKVPEHPKNIAVQGLIYCNYGSKLIPLEGATARVTCLTVRKDGYESAPFSFSSCPADKKGYFLAKIPSSKLPKDDLWEIKECKAFLENSPWVGCKVAEDTNGGVRGARVVFSRHLNREGYCLSSVGPFIFNSGHQSLPKEGY